MVTAAAQGFSLADPYAIGLLAAGLALFAGVGALSHQHDRAFSASVIYLGIGAAAAAVIAVTDLDWVDPLADPTLFEKASELAVIIALFATGLKLDRELRFPAWSNVTRLLVVAMPLTIGAVALFGATVMGLSLGAAIVLGAVLAPTDPVLAGDIGVGPPGDEDEHEPNFSITGEAGLNDGFAFPFLFLGIILAGDEQAGWLAEWLAADVVYKIVLGIALGVALGYGIGGLAVRLRDRELLAPSLDGWLAPASVLLIYGATEALGAYGFLAAFFGGVAFRRYERGHEYNARVHGGAEMIEKFGELALVLLVASSLTIAGLGEPGPAGWVLVPTLLLVIRPAAVALALMRSGLGRSERAFVAWFGVRGVGSVYYAAVAVGTGALSRAEGATVLWTALACVVVSIVVHGITSAPLSRRWLAHRA